MGVSLQRNWCCVGGGITRYFGFINRVVNWPPLRGSEADVSSVSPSLQRSSSCGSSMSAFRYGAARYDSNCEKMSRGDSRATFYSF